MLIKIYSSKKTSNKYMYLLINSSFLLKTLKTKVLLLKLEYLFIINHKSKSISLGKIRPKVNMIK